MIRRAIYDDAAAIARIHVGTWRTAYAGIVPDEYLASLSEEKRLKSWQQQLTDGKTVILVAEKDGEVIGWASGGMSRDEDSPGDSELYAIYILSQHWGGGIGRKLMEKMEDSLPAAKSTTLWVLQDNHRAIQFYERMGYHPDDAQKKIQLGGKEFIELRFRKTKPANGAG